MWLGINKRLKANLSLLFYKKANVVGSLLDCRSFSAQAIGYQLENQIKLWLCNHHAQQPLGCRYKSISYSFAFTLLIALSVIAVIDKLGFTPGLAEIILPSQIIMF